MHLYIEIEIGLSGYDIIDTSVNCEQFCNMNSALLAPVKAASQSNAKSENSHQVTAVLKLDSVSNTKP